MGLVETCANCGQTIGKLEAAHVWGHHVVCQACFHRLADSVPVQEVRPPPPTPPDDLTTIAYQSAAPPRQAAYHPTAKKAKAGDSAGFVVLSIILLLLAVVSELGGQPLGSYLFVGLWVVLLIVRLAVTSMSK